MTRQTRRLIFWTAVFAFVIFTPIIIGYARGYRFDLIRGELTQVGAISLDSKPKNAAIILNGQVLSKKTPAVIRNLLPFRTYTTRVEKSGFLPWGKELLVEPEKIAHARNIYLFPTKPSFKESAVTSSSFVSATPSPSGQYIAAVDQNQLVNIVNLQNNERIPLFFGDQIRTVSIDPIKWSSNGNNLLLGRNIQGRKIWYLFDLRARSIKNITSLYERTIASLNQDTLPAFFTAKEVKFLSDDGNALVAIVGDELVVLNVMDQTVQGLAIESTAFTIVNRSVVSLDREGQVIVAQSGNYATSTLTNLEFSPQELITSPDNKKVAYRHDYGIGVLWLEKSEIEPLRQVGDHEIIYHSLKPIESLYWHYSSEYIIAFTQGKELIAIELDGRENRNTYTWKLQEALKVYYTLVEKMLWMLDKKGNLSFIEDF